MMGKLWAKHGKDVDAKLRHHALDWGPTLIDCFRLIVAAMDGAEDENPGPES
jgi:hypothetical protein